VVLEVDLRWASIQFFNAKIRSSWIFRNVRAIQGVSVFRKKKVVRDMSCVSSS